MRGTSVHNNYPMRIWYKESPCERSYLGGLSTHTSKNSRFSSSMFQLKNQNIIMNDSICTCPECDEPVLPQVEEQEIPQDEED